MEMGEKLGTTSEAAVESSGVGAGHDAAPASVSDVVISATTTAVVPSVVPTSDSASAVAQVTKAKATTSAAVKTKNKSTISTSDNKVGVKPVIVKPLTNRPGSGAVPPSSNASNGSNSGVSKKSSPSGSHRTVGDKKTKPK